MGDDDAATSQREDQPAGDGAMTWHWRRRDMSDDMAPTGREGASKPDAWRHGGSPTWVSPVRSGGGGTMARPTSDGGVRCGGSGEVSKGERDSDECTRMMANRGGGTSARGLERRRKSYGGAAAARRWAENREEENGAKEGTSSATTQAKSSSGATSMAAVVRLQLR